ncbi:MAG: DUF29 domain-containing protein [Acidobacteriota bacterium]|nr:DUF29 domain-containing protein [Acidobacteriota bacterium]
MRPYESDYAGWAEDTARAIWEGRWSDVDRGALADEVADLARKERRTLRSRFSILFAHLLKQRFQPAKSSRSWELTIAEQRLQLGELLQENPSLARGSEIRETMARAYAIARLRASRESGLALDLFPMDVPFSDAEIWGTRSTE